MNLVFIVASLMHFNYHIIKLPIVIFIKLIFFAAKIHFA